MQQNEPGTGSRQGRTPPQNDHILRQMRFALVLSGDSVRARQLVAQLLKLQNQMPESEIQPQLSPAARLFLSFSKLYELWHMEKQNKSAKAPVFQPGGEREAIQNGLDPQLARAMGALPSQHRLLLLLIYGEQFSYAASAQLLKLSIEELMSMQAVAHRAFARQIENGARQKADAKEQAVAAPMTAFAGKGVKLAGGSP